MPELFLPLVLKNGLDVTCGTTISYVIFPLPLSVTQVNFGFGRGATFFRRRRISLHVTFMRQSILFLHIECCFRFTRCALPKEEGRRPCEVELRARAIELSPGFRNFRGVTVKEMYVQSVDLSLHASFLWTEGYTPYTSQMVHHCTSHPSK
jgi:hypothetical protein